jgi:sugar/nucleoside kinase (ribokinase family)
MPRNKLLVVGHVARDVVKTKTGGSEFWGGAGYHVAMAAALFLEKNQVLIFANAGYDFDAKLMENEGVDVHKLIINNELETDRHFVDESGEERTYVGVGGLSDQIDLSSIEEVIGEVAWIHLASSPPAQQMRWLDQLEKHRNGEITFSADTFDTFAREIPNEVRTVFKRCDWAMVNNSEWDGVKVDDLGINIVKKLGGDGAQIYHGKDLAVETGCSGSVDVADTTGAGEVVAGVFIANKLLGKSNEESLRMAVEMATKSVTDFGTDHLRVRG